MSDSDILRRLETVGVPPDKWIIIVYKNYFIEIFSLGYCFGALHVWILKERDFVHFVNVYRLRRSHIVGIYFRLDTC